MAKADKTVAFRPSVEVWELLKEEKSYSEVIETALKRFYGLEAGEDDSLGKSQTPSEDAIASVIEEKLQSYQANFNEALARVWERLEAVEAAPDTAKDNASQETRSRLDQLTQRLEKLETAPTNLDAMLIQKDLSTTAHSDDLTPPQPKPPVVPRKTDTDGGDNEAAPVEAGKWITGVELGKRLGLADGSAISKHKKDPKHFADYTQVRDPDGIAWKWNGKEKKNARYSPIT